MSKLNYEFRNVTAQQAMATYRLTGAGEDFAVIHRGVAPQLDGALLILEVNANLPVEDIKACLLTIIADMEQNGVYDEMKAKAEQAKRERELGSTLYGNDLKGH